MRSSNTRFTFSPTVPLSSNRIRSRKWFNSVTSMILPFGAGLGMLAGYAMGWSVAGIFSSAIASMAVSLFAYWHLRSDQITQRAIRELVAESNQDQDEAIREQIATLLAAGSRELAKCLQEFLNLKQELEFAIHQDGKWNERKARLELLVDGLCSVVADELRCWSILEQQTAKVILSRSHGNLESFEATRRGHIDRIMRAHGLLRKTQQQLHVILNQPVVSGHNEAEIEADDEFASFIMNELDQENTIASRIVSELGDAHTLDYAEAI